MTVANVGPPSAGTRAGDLVEARVVDALGTHRRAGPASWPHRAEGPVSWRMPWAGSDQEVELLRYAGDNPAPDHRLQLWLKVGPSPAAR
jgi:hypothetical protein